MRTPRFTAAPGLLGLFALAWPAPAHGKPAAKSTHHAPPRCPTGETVDPQALPAELYRRARCDELEGQLVTALEHYELALRRHPSALLARQLQARIGALIPRLGTLRLDASAWPAADTRVRVGTRVVDTRAAFVDPGRVEIVVEAPGFEPARQTVDVAVGEEKAVTLPAPRSRGAVPSAPTTANAPAPRLAVAVSPAVYGPPSAEGSTRPVGYSGLAVGGAAAAACSAPIRRTNAYTSGGSPDEASRSCLPSEERGELARELLESLQATASPEGAVRVEAMSWRARWSSSTRGLKRDRA